MVLIVKKTSRPVTTERGELMYRTTERVYVDDTPALGRGKRLLYPEGVLIPLSRAKALGLVSDEAPKEDETVSSESETASDAAVEADDETIKEDEAKPDPRPKGERVARTTKVSQPET